MFPRKVIKEMADKADAAINLALFNGAQPMRGGSHSELAYVGAVTLDGLHGISAAWKPICRGLGMTMRLLGVYCHAAPQVLFDGKVRRTKCELADLLVVTDVKKKGVLTRRAALIQAKMARAKDRVSLAGDSSRKQLDLYQNWYRFDFVESAYSMKRVDFLVGADPGSSGTFGVIDPRFYGEPRWSQLAARPTPQRFSSQTPQLGRFIAEMTVGTRPGFGRLATPSLRTDWSKTVELLLTETYARAFTNKARNGPPRPPRGTTAIVCFGNSSMQVAGGASFLSGGRLPPYGDLMESRSGREGRGLSTVHFEVSSAPDLEG
jgi:hypothetical protein